ncbi:hypothetical protein BJ170DRAFT_43196 [Xylariales sp. AK1849]|nr:hypothetical protein BJ170DRAFT_43196 [Xylariales sp. AK1849]
MAAPASKTIGDLTGKWVMSKTLSDSPEPGLALQGISWVTRKAIGLATITLHTKQYTDAEGLVHIDIDQTATGGIKGTSENRVIGAPLVHHSDWLFGKVEARSEWLAGPLAEHESIKEHGVDHLAKGWLEGDEEKTGPGGVAHLVTWVVSENGWTACQVWGFQTIGGERRYARNVVIKKGDKKVDLRLVYDFVPE